MILQDMSRHTSRAVQRGGLARGFPDPMKHVIYVDSKVIVLNKPSGLVSQGSVVANTDKMREHYTFKFNSLLQGLKDALHMSTLPYPVHRLDKNTTGCLILARTDHVARELSTQFRNRTIIKKYLALVQGGRHTFQAGKGEIRNHLHYEDGRACIVGEGAGKPAATDWELVAASETAPVSLLRLTLHTGLKHQLRVHLSKVLKAPILGETTHSKMQAAIDVPEDRLFLHSSHLSFFRYRSQGARKRYRFGVTAPIPRDFKQLCDRLKIYPQDSEMKGGVTADESEIQESELSELQGCWFGRD
ncbi:pseudouridine synthase [Heliocybe sulcata]|uniref:21S rRNA pseudouridine(2819) synthase n=1 Tax=Heliocybe sulcata TaxID=5364 RepID=A0A5C3N013_9AGAM|nr:pseudouridine synthase [Heliocybe sulcata]